MQQISPILGASIISICVFLLVPFLFIKLTMFSSTYLFPLLSLFAIQRNQAESSSTLSIDLNWYPPNTTKINDLNAAINGTEVFGGFIFNSSQNPDGKRYGTYNWCNMPHVRREEYVIPPAEYQLEYVEVVSGHCSFCHGLPLWSTKLGFLA
jgi:hypothetical protein